VGEWRGKDRKTKNDDIGLDDLQQVEERVGQCRKMATLNGRNCRQEGMQRNNRRSVFVLDT